MTLLRPCGASEGEPCEAQSAMQGVDLANPDLVLESGLTLREAAQRAQAWWDAEGRHLFRNPEFRDPDLGLKSGITRGLPFDRLEREEIAAVIEAWHRDKVLALIPAEFRKARVVG